MRATTFATAAVLGLASQASAETIRIDVGENGLAFTPDSVTAKVNDILEFHFHPINHSVVLGDFANPCQPAKTGAFFSGFQPVSSGEGSEVFQVTVNSTDPMFFYCSQNVLSHCISGMSGVVNPNSTQTLDAYQKAAKNAKDATNPSAPIGGRLVSSGSSTTSSAAPAATTSCTVSSKSSGNSYKRSNTCNGAGSVTASVGLVGFALGMAILLS
ncbi:Cupredoxin [Trichoderma austrokoningii]